MSAAHALVTLLGGLHNALGELGDLVRSVALDWPDDRGRAWVEHAEATQRELGRQADLSAVLARIVGRLAEELAEAGDSTAVGPQLGGTDGARADNARGIRIATLPDRPQR